jgi:two-component system response regulator FixJ
MLHSNLIHLVDSDTSSRQAISAVLTENDYSVLIHHSDEAFLTTLGMLPPGSVLLRIEQDADGLSILPRLLAMDFKWPIVVMVRDAGGHTIFRTIGAGAVYSMGAPAEPDLLRALQAAGAGPAARPADAISTERLQARLRQVSAREREVLTRLAAGHTHKVIARELGISPRTVEVHRANIMRKLRLQHSADLIQVAMLAGLPWNGAPKAAVALTALRDPATAA